MALSTLPSGLVLVEQRAADGGPILLGGAGGGSLGGAAAAAAGEAGGGRGGGVVRENGGGAGAEGTQGDSAEEMAFVQTDVALVLGLDDLSLSQPPSGAADDGGVVGRLKQRQDDVGTLYITTRRVVWLSAHDSRVGYSVDFLSLGVHALCRDSESYPRPCIYMQIDRPEDDDASSDEDDDGDEEVEDDGEEEGEEEEDHNTMREGGDAGRGPTTTTPAEAAAAASTASPQQAEPASLAVGAEGLRDSAQDAAGAVVAAGTAATAAVTGSATSSIHGRDENEEQQSAAALAHALAQVSEVRLVPRDPSCLDVVFKNLCLCAALNPDPVGEREGEGEWYFNEEEVQESMGVGAAEGDVPLGHPLQVDSIRPQPHANGQLLLDDDDDDRFEDADEEDEEME